MDISPSWMEFCQDYCGTLTREGITGQEVCSETGQEELCGKQDEDDTGASEQ